MKTGIRSFRSDKVKLEIFFPTFSITKYIIGKHSVSGTMSLSMIAFFVSKLMIGENSLANSTFNDMIINKPKTGMKIG